MSRLERAALLLVGTLRNVARGVPIGVTLLVLFAPDVVLPG